MSKHVKQQLMAIGTSVIGVGVASQIDFKLLSGLVLLFTGVIAVGILVKEG